MSSELQIPSFIEFEFRLRICLHLHPTVEFSIGDTGILIKTNEVFEEKDSKFGSGQGIEILSDTEGGFRFTSLTVLVPDNDPSIPTDNLKDAYENDVVSAVNRFIDTYRYLTGRHGIANVHSLNDFHQVGVYRQRSGAEEPTRFISVSFGPDGAISTLRPFRTAQEHAHLEKYLAETDIPLEDLFLMDARRYAASGHTIQALINAVIAVEIVARQIPRQKQNWFFRLFRKKESLQYTVRKRLSELKMNATKINNVVGAIRQRNKIVHGGKRVLRGNINNYLHAIEESISALKILGTHVACKNSL